jgi:uncharacterized protein YegP (UPF0339 family)
LGARNTSGRGQLGTLQRGVTMRRTILGGLVLAGLFIGVGTTIPDSVVAQAKKDDKAGKDKGAKSGKDKNDAKGAGVIEVTKGKDDKYRFFVRDADGKLLAMSGPGGFATTKDAEAAIDTLKEVVAKAKVNVKD